MFSRAALKAFVSVTIWLSGGGPVGAGAGAGATAGLAALACCFGAGLVLRASLGGVTVISGSVAWPRAHSTAAWTASALDASNSMRRKGGRIVSSPDARTRCNTQVNGGRRQRQTFSGCGGARERNGEARAAVRGRTKQAGSATEYVVLGRMRSGPAAGMSVEAT